MKTSYFAKYKKSDGVSIALKSPPGFKGKTYPDLAPPPILLKNYKEGLYTQKDYIAVYEEMVLASLDPQKVYNDLKDSVLLCWEGKGKFCHRRIVADWLEKNLEVKVEEF